MLRTGIFKVFFFFIESLKQAKVANLEKRTLNDKF